MSDSNANQPQETPKVDNANSTPATPPAPVPVPDASATEPAKTEPVVEQKEPVKEEAAKTDPPKEEPAKAEPPKEEKKPDAEIKYDLKAPETLSKESVEAVLNFAKENKLSNEQAQKILDRDAVMTHNFIETQKRELETRQAEWINRAKADPELGGDKINENVELSKRVLQRFGSPELTEVLESTGVGNYPELVRVFARIGRAMGEDKLVIPNSTEQANVSAAKLIYG